MCTLRIPIPILYILCVLAVVSFFGVNFKKPISGLVIVFFPREIFYSYLYYSVLQFNTYIYLNIYPCEDLTVLCSLIFYFCYNFGYLFVCLFLFGRKNIGKTPLGC